MTHPLPEGFQWDFRISYAAVARAVGVDEETVRGRVRRMQEDGFILGWEVVVNPGLLGRSMVRAMLPPQDRASRAKVLSALTALDGAAWVFEYHSGAFAAVLLATPGGMLDRTAALLAAIAGQPPALVTVPCATPRIEPTPQDWRIIRSLRRDPRRPYADLAAEVGVSERTVRRRVEALVDGRGLLLSVTTDHARVRGGLAATVFVVHEGGPSCAAVEQAMRTLPGLIFSSSSERPPSGRMLWASFYTDGIADLDAFQGRLAGMPGVQRVQADFAVRRVSAQAWLDEEIARRAA